MSVCAVSGCPNLKPCPQHGRPQRKGSTRAWRTRRARILNRDGHTCQQCGQWAKHVDHVIARELGGSDADSNLQALCADCNLSKGVT